MLEWGLALLVVLLVAAYFGREFRYVQGQAELAAVKTTLGALRTALLLDHLKNAAEGASPASAVQTNPFLLLATVPANYSGVLSEAKGKPLRPGTWVFDAYCRCIGYEPLYAYALNTPADAGGLWFRVSAPPGPLQISAMQAYRWQDQVLE
jgi:hypothetical protein